MNEKIFVALSSFCEKNSEPLELIKQSGYKYGIYEGGKRIIPEDLLRLGEDATVIIAGVELYDKDILEKLPRLRCISRLGVGVDSIDLNYSRERGLAVLNTPGLPTIAVAELALTMMLCLSKNLIPQTRLMAERKWQRLETHLLNGRVVGILGFGEIGRAVAKLCLAFGAVVMINDPAYQNNVGNLAIQSVDKETLFKSCDIVSVHASAIGETQFIVSNAEIGLMKMGSILINLARGNMVDEIALAEALHSGKIAGAGLDVFSREPYEGPLCDFKNVILTPHSATNTVETRVAMELKAVQNAINFLKNPNLIESRVI
jgi:D-3-phosphoglycerate dehydrogenase